MPRQPSRSRRLLLFLSILSSMFLAGVAQAGPTPFQARYVLSIDGWPDARISHRLSRTDEGWTSEMRAAMAVAEGVERSRFRLEAGHLEPLGYVSSYRLLGLGERYSLVASDLRSLPDRQTALFALSRQARKARCTHPQTAPCTIRYLDHEGEEETLNYRVVSRDDVALPQGRFPGLHIDAWEPDKTDRHLLMTFHASIPGLLLGLEYRRDGKVTSRLRLTQLAAPDDQDS
ncbi:MAG: hypothetical protein UMU75_01505 [Halomonas sp.]|nr:hypothetical protein [Halomonas sp.]